MRNIFGIFAKSPFKPLIVHMERSRECYGLLRPLLEAAYRGEEAEVDRLFKQIHDLEHAADEVKDRIREMLPATRFLPVDRRDLLQALKAQDEIPDAAEDIGMLIRIRKTQFPEWIREPGLELLDKSLSVCNTTAEIVGSLDALLQSSFSGPEAEDVLDLVERAGVLEHETDVLGYRLAKLIYAHEAELSPVDIFILNDVFRGVGKLANAAETVAKTFRLFLAR